MFASPGMTRWVTSTRDAEAGLGSMATSIRHGARGRPLSRASDRRYRIRPSPRARQNAAEVTLIDHARDPLSKLYGAYRTCYTPKTPARSGAIRDGRIAPEAIREFIGERLKTGAPRRSSRSCSGSGSRASRARSHQFVRHRIGISFEQQSQRYVRYKEERLDYSHAEDLARRARDGGRVRPAHARDHPRLRARAREGIRPRTRASSCRTPRPRTSR